MDKYKILVVCALYAGLAGLVDAENNNCCLDNCREKAVNMAQNYSDFLSAAAKCNGPSNNASFNSHDQSSPPNDYGNTSTFGGR